jgi:hypothetical protein
MSLNHIIKGAEEGQLIDIACKSLAPIGDLTITCDDLTTFNLKPPSLGTAGQVLKSDGLGNTYFGNDTAGSSELIIKVLFLLLLVVILKYQIL